MASTKSGKGDGWSIVVGIICLAGGLAGCAGSGGNSLRLEHSDLGYSIPNPGHVESTEQAVWQFVDVKNADFAYRGPGDSMMAISSRCAESQTDPAVLGRQLLIGLPDRTRLSSERFDFAGGHAYSQIVKSGKDADSVRTKTVTLVRAGCVIDWVLAAAEYSAQVEAAFDLWWRGFDPGAMPAPAASAGEAGP